jgi:hypothetical protein
LQPKVRVYLNYDIMYLEPFDKHTNYLLTEIWTRPTITYGFVVCFETEKEEKKLMLLNQLN